MAAKFQTSKTRLSRVLFPIVADMEEPQRTDWGSVFVSVCWCLYVNTSSEVNMCMFLHILFMFRLVSSYLIIFPYNKSVYCLFVYSCVVVCNCLYLCIEMITWVSVLLRLMFVSPFLFVALPVCKILDTTVEADGRQQRAWFCTRFLCCWYKNCINKKNF